MWTLPAILAVVSFSQSLISNLSLQNLLNLLHQEALSLRACLVWKPSLVFPGPDRADGSAAAQSFPNNSSQSQPARPGSELPQPL